jgi:serine/threonine protein kinase
MKNKPDYHIALLVNIILQPAIAGGISEEEAKKLFNKILNSISSLHPSHNQFSSLLDDIINKWAVPIIKEYGHENEIPHLDISIDN